jgi:hypothetical protein
MDNLHSELAPRKGLEEKDIPPGADPQDFAERFPGLRACEPGKVRQWAKEPRTGWLRGIGGLPCR